MDWKALLDHLIPRYSIKTQLRRASICDEKWTQDKIGSSGEDLLPNAHSSVAGRELSQSIN